MKILFVGFRSAWPLHRGERLPIYYLGRELQARGHSVDLLAFAEQPSDADDVRHYASLFASVELIAEPERPAAAYTQRLTSPDARWPRRADDAWSPEMWRAIERRLDTAHYDVVQLFGGPQVYEFFHALRGLPAVINPLDSQSLFLRRSFFQDNLDPRYRAERRAQWMIARAYEEWMFSPYARTVVVSPVDRDELLSVNPALRVEVIPNGIDPEQYRPQPTARDAATLVYVGDYTYAPNIDAALELANRILPAVQQTIPDARLWLVGNAPPPQVQALAGEYVAVTGYVPEIQPYLAQAAVFVSPLRVGSGIKNKVLQALALGCPVVATPLSLDGIAVTDGHDALIADHAALADATVRLLNDIGLRQRLSANGPALIRARYTWEQVAGQVEALYAEVQASR